MSNEIKVSLGGFEADPSLAHSVTTLEKIRTIYQELITLKGSLGKATSASDVSKASVELEKQAVAMQKLRAEMEKIAAQKLANEAKIDSAIQKQQAMEDKLAASRQKSATQETLDAEKISQAKLRTTTLEEQAETKRATRSAKEQRDLQMQSGLIGQLQLKVKELNKERVFAKSEDDIKRINVQLTKTKEEISNLNNLGKEGQNTFGKAVGSFQFKFNYLANLAAQGTTAGLSMIKNFGEESIKIAMEAEKNMKQLSLAVTGAMGESAVSVQLLIDQSEELQDKGIFSHGQIQQADTQLANYGLSADKIKELIPLISDMAAATGKDLTDATDLAIKGMNGQVKGLKLLGINYKDTGSKADNLALLTKGLTKFQGDNAAQLNTSAGAMKRWENIWDDVKESIGNFLLGAGKGLLDFWDVLDGKTTMGGAIFKQAIADASDQATKDVADFTKGLKGSVEEQTAAINKEMLKQAEVIKLLGDKVDADNLQTAQVQEQLAKDKIKALADYRADLLKTSTFTGGDDSGTAVATLTDLKSKIAAIRDLREQDGIKTAEDELKRKADEDIAYADLTITDATTLANKHLEIKTKLIDDLNALDKTALEYKAQRDIEDVNAETASAQQKADLIVAINTKLIADEMALDEQAANDKIDASKTEFDALATELKTEMDQQIADADDAAAKQKELEKTRYDDIQSLRLLEAKNNAADLLAAEKQNAKEDFDQAMTLLDAKHDAGLIAEEDYQRERKILILKYNQDVDDLNKASYDKQLDQLSTLISSTSTLLQDNSTARKEQLQNDLTAQENSIQRQETLADRGLDNTLAFEERKKAELEKKMLDEERRQKKLKLEEAFLNAFVQYMKEDPPSAAAGKAALDVAVGSAAAGKFEKGGRIAEELRIGKNGRISSGRFYGSRHDQGGILIEAQGEEGILSVPEMRNLGGNFEDIRALAKQPLDDGFFRTMNEQIVPIVMERDSSKENAIVGAINSLKEEIRNKPVSTFEVDKFGDVLETMLEGERKKVIKHFNYRRRT